VVVLNVRQHYKSSISFSQSKSSAPAWGSGSDGAAATLLHEANSRVCDWRRAEKCYEIEVVHRAMLKDLFLSMDDDGSGMLEEPEIKMLAIALGQKLSPNEIRAGMRPSLGSAARPPAGSFVTNCVNHRNWRELIEWGQLWLRWTRTVRAKLISRSSMSGGLVIRRAQCSRQGQRGHLRYITKSSRTIEPLACRSSATIPLSSRLAGSAPHVPPRAGSG
jgi:hypothetical protein